MDTKLFSGTIPANYDKYLGPYLFEPYALDLAQRLKDDDCKIVLELACGTGRVTNHLIEVLAQDGKLVATDLNSDMMAVAQAKVTDKRVDWMVVDALQLPFDDATFDHVICQFGIMFFEDKPNALRQIYKVLKPKGKFVFNTWASLEENKKAGLIKDVMEEIFAEEAPDFLQKGPYSLGDVDEIKGLLTGAGFKNISVEPVRKVAEYQNVEDYIKGFVDGSPLSAFVQKREGAARDEVKQKLRQALLEKFGDSPEMDMLAYVCSGTKNE